MPRAHSRYRLHPPLFCKRVYRARRPECRAMTLYLHRDDRLPFKLAQLDEPPRRHDAPLGCQPIWPKPTSHPQPICRDSMYLQNDKAEMLSSFQPGLALVAVPWYWEVKLKAARYTKNDG